MRRLLLILMIALLPLRGWAGDAMATGMAAGQMAQMQQTHVATENIAAHAHAASEKAHFDYDIAAPHTGPMAADCAGHGADDGDASHCDTCSACQACHAVALAHSGHKVPSTFQAFALPHSAADQFASADAALRQKPPIS